MSGAVYQGSDFGLKPETGFDNYAAIAACCQRLVDGDTLVLARGIYEVHAASLPASERIFEVIGKDNITINGAGATILICGAMRANTVYFENCRNPAVRDLVIDVRDTPFSQGTVIARDDISMTVSLDKGCFVPDMKNIKAFYDFDAATRHIIGNFDASINAVESISPAGDGTVRIVFKRPAQREKAEVFPFSMEKALGSRMVMKSSLPYKDYHVDIVSCENVLIDGVRIHAGAQMGMHVTRTKNIDIRNTRVERSPGTDRLLSVNYDSLHIIYVKGSISISNCSFEASGDDGININCGKYLGIAEIYPDRRSVITKKVTMGYNGETPKPGETMSIIDERTFQTIGILTVEKAAWQPQKNGYAITFAERVDALTSGHILFNTKYMPSRVHISGCTFKDIRGRGLFLSVGNLTIENCTFEHTSYPAIMVFGMTKRQAAAGANITIRNNRLSGMAGGGIYMNAHDMYDNAHLKPGAFTNVRILDNIIEEDAVLHERRFKSVIKKYPYWSAGMYLSGIHGIEVHGNRIIGFPMAFFATADKDVSISRNIVDTNAFILLDEGTVEGLNTEMRTRSFVPEEFNKQEFYVQQFN